MKRQELKEQKRIGRRKRKAIVRKVAVTCDCHFSAQKVPFLTQTSAAPATIGNMSQPKVTITVSVENPAAQLTEAGRGQ